MTEAARKNVQIHNIQFMMMTSCSIRKLVPPSHSFSFCLQFWSQVNYMHLIKKYVNTQKVCFYKSGNTPTKKAITIPKASVCASSSTLTHTFTQQKEGKNRQRRKDRTRQGRKEKESKSILTTSFGSEPYVNSLCVVWGWIDKEQNNIGLRAWRILICFFVEKQISLTWLSIFVFPQKKSFPSSCAQYSVIQCIVIITRYPLMNPVEPGITTGCKKDQTRNEQSKKKHVLKALFQFQDIIMSQGKTAYTRVPPFTKLSMMGHNVNNNAINKRTASCLPFYCVFSLLSSRKVLQSSLDLAYVL